MELSTSEEKLNNQKLQLTTIMPTVQALQIEKIIQAPHALDIEKIETKKIIQAPQALLPIKHENLYNKYISLVSRFWVETEIPGYPSLYKDDYSLLPKKFHKMLYYIILWNASAEEYVLRNLSLISINDRIARMILDYEKVQENTHNMAYSLIAQRYLKIFKPLCNIDEEMNNFLNDPSIKCIEQWVDNKINIINKNTLNNIDTTANIFVIIAMIESMFSSLFAIIYAMETYFPDIKLNALYNVNEWVTRDETLHIYTNALIYTTVIENKVSEEYIHKIAEEIVDVSSDYIKLACENSLMDLTYENLIIYGKYIIDLTLAEMDYTKKFNVENPFKFMDRILMTRSNNFFDDRHSTNYSRKLETIDFDN